MAIIQTVLNYNRAQLSNFADSSSILIGTANVLLAEFGLFEPAGTQFIQLQTTVGWNVTDVSPVPPDQTLLQLTIFRDGVPIASAEQESISNEEDTPLENLASFQTIIRSTTVGHHVYQLFALNEQPEQGTITVTGPVSISAMAIGTP
ncbi:hypothetical protein [Cohnella zeiphila]|uniref:Exosporium protein C n=1 Tax=Cohnella zeiphila TaxID=2761120 RepID=A0A7X0SQZ4_9BACL|nr:hypothetical protein [Cohnella zeiphila]MBB6733499.1 hypothetical protein [Cohnella zeiphila]